MMFSQKLNSHRILKGQAKALIRLRVWAGWSEPLLAAHTTMLDISCPDSYYITIYIFLLVLSADIIYKQCGPRASLTKLWAWIGSKLFDLHSDGIRRKKKERKKDQQMQKSMQNDPEGKE